LINIFLGKEEVRSSNLLIGSLKSSEFPTKFMVQCKKQ
jgi:hypothetical protein